MTDVRLFQTNDGGEVEITNGRFTLDDTLSTAAYLSLFGGNERDNGTKATESLQWWGNATELDRTKHVRSETQHLLRSLPAVTGNLARITDAVSRDLSWMVDALDAAVSSTVRMPARNTVRIEIAIEIDGRTTELEFTERWAANA